MMVRSHERSLLEPRPRPRPRPRPHPTPHPPGILNDSGRATYHVRGHGPGRPRAGPPRPRHGPGHGPGYVRGPGPGPVRHGAATARAVRTGRGRGRVRPALRAGCDVRPGRGPVLVAAVTRAGATVPAADDPPRGWAAPVWALRVALLTARARLPYATAGARLLDGVERWVRMSGRGRAASGPWWAHAVALTAAAAAAVDDPPTSAILAPWVGLAVPAPVAGTGFRPLGG